MAEENPSRIEPCLLESCPTALVDIIADLSSKSTKLGAPLHPDSAASLSELVRVMNCYYSNLIEGHNTRPLDIERALADVLDVEDDERRDLQREALAHIRVQRTVDRESANGTFGEPASRDRILWLHRHFYDDASFRMLRVDHPRGAYQMTPGAFRSEPFHDVTVGRLVPPSSPVVMRFMEYFESRYRFQGLGTSARIIAMAASHHRFNFIHPFPDGNGRVSRLVSHAMGWQAGIAAHGLWSISRGLARGLTDVGEYKRMMDAADAPRQGDLDGRGNLSQRALVEFVTWFCRVALDQVSFMADLFDLENLQVRLTRYVRESLRLPDYAAAIPIEVLRRGELPRGEAARVTGRPERTARAAMSQLLSAGLLVSDSPKSPVRLRFGSDSADALFPRLFSAETTTSRAPNVHDAQELWAQVRQAAGAWVSRSLVCLAQQRASERVNALATGTAIRTPGGRVVILTAWHNVSDLQENPWSLIQDSWPSAVQRGVTHAIEGPADCDVAIAIPSPQAHEVLVRARCTVDSASIATSNDDVVDSTHWLVMGGYLGALTSEAVDHSRKTVTQSFGSVTYAFPFAPRDALRRRYRIPWIENAVVSSLNPIDARAASVRVGDSEPLPQPHGVSGGPVWRVQTGTPPNDLWTPEKRLKLVGVATSYLEPERIEFAESVASWGNWFHETIAAIDRTP
ncbi:MAG TPA: Fic family protein [Polyangiaceae bacterium]|nr:Fic family protein [Polyangiaceae bacterium]